MKKRFWNSDKFLSLFAVLLSVGTLLLFIYQTNLIRKQQYASVYPYLEMGFHQRGFEKMKYVLTNVGVGPALIEKIEIRTKEGAYEGYFSDFLMEMVERQGSDSIYFAFTDIAAGKMIPAGESLELISCHNRYSSERMLELIDQYQVELNITYASVYGEVWYISSNTTVPEKR